MSDWLSPIRLAYATAQDFHPSSGVSVSYTNVVVRVDNLGYEKQVMLHFREGTSWSQHLLPWIEGFGDHDVFATPPGSLKVVAQEIALGYLVNGQIYWDSRLGANYPLGANMTIVAGNIAFVEATTSFSPNMLPVQGKIHVNNLSQNKSVGIRYSLDEGSSWQNASASYAGPAPEVVNLGLVEVWQFGVLAPPSLHPMRFAAYYQNLHTGETFWDNNFGHNYSIPLSPGSHIR